MQNFNTANCILRFASYYIQRVCQCIETHCKHSYSLNQHKRLRKWTEMFLALVYLHLVDNRRAACSELPSPSHRPPIPQCYSIDHNSPGQDSVSLHLVVFWPVQTAALAASKRQVSFPSLVKTDGLITAGPSSCLYTERGSLPLFSPLILSATVFTYTHTRTHTEKQTIQPSGRCWGRFCPESAPGKGVGCFDLSWVR